MTINEYIRNVKINNWTPFNGKLWQRNDYEHVVRNEKSLNEIRECIVNNPKNPACGNSYEKEEGRGLCPRPSKR